MKHVEKAAPLAAAAATTSIGAVVSAYRGWFLAGSAALLAIGIVHTTRVQRTCATRSRGSMAVLALSGTIVVLVVLFPQLLAGLIADWMP